MLDILEEKVDRWLLISSFFLLILGFLTLTSASIYVSEKNYGFGFYYSLRQIVVGFLPGIILGLILYKVDFSKLKKWSFFLLLLNILFLVLVFVPKIGLERGGARRWINLKYFTFQPSEYLKLIFILYLSSWLESRLLKKKEGTLTFFAFLFLLGAISLLLILQPDFSTLLIIWTISLSVYFLLDTPLWHIVLLAVILFLVGTFILVLTPYRVQRILAFLNPESDPLGMSYQLKQGIIAIGAGRIFGSGIGLSKQKLGILPQSITDAIFPIFAEEWGFVGCVLLFYLYLIFFWRGIKIGREQKNIFAKSIAFGISVWIISQTILNIGGMLKLLPLAGVPLPFISYGGSALSIEIGAIGLLLKISKTK